MKKAVIVVGSHFSGKSKTIKKYFKPKVGLSGNQRAFNLSGEPGMVMSQSLEEKRFGQVISQTAEEKRLPDLQKFLSRYLSCRWLVLAARPDSESGSRYKEIVATLTESGFEVDTVTIFAGQIESFYEQRAVDIFDYLSGDK